MPSAARTVGRDLGRTKDELVRVATEHFTRNGYFGARVDEIAEDTATTKRMIYYCFGSKDGLFEACLTRAYEGIRAAEQSLGLEELEPPQAIARYVEATLRYHEAHPELARLVRAENLLEAHHLKAGPHESSSAHIVAILNRIVSAGHAAGQFRSGITGLQIHLLVSALANYRITNAATFQALFGVNVRDPAALDDDIAAYVHLALAWLVTTPDDLGIDADELGRVALPRESGTH